MTAPFRGRSAVSDYHQWRYLPLSVDVLCANDVLEAIRVEAVDGFNSLPHGGLETGGILFGRQTECSVEILAFEPIECEHKTGPSFVLSEKDEMALQAALADPRPGNLQPIGLYMTHSRRGFSLVESDQRILDHYFPKPWHMALLLMPSKVGPTRAGFFIRNPGGEPAYLCAHEFLIQAPERYGKGEESAHPDNFNTLPDDAIPARLAPVAVVPVPNGIEPLDRQALALTTLHSFLSPGKKHRRSHWWKLIGALGLVILCAAMAASLWTRSRVVPSPPLVALHISDLGSKVRIEWDPTREQVRAAAGASLEIRDGDSLPVYLPIERDGLDSGGIVYAPRSEKLEVRLKLLHGGGPPSESAPYFFINPARSTAAPPLEPVPATAPADVPSVVSTPEPRSGQPAQTEIQKQEQARTRIQEAPARIRGAARSFRPPVKHSFGGTGLGTQASLPDLPEIHPVQQPLPAPLPSTPPIGVRPPPAPIASQTHAPDPPQPRSGRLIWTGSLRKSGLLSLSPAGASLGVLNGRFPGFPVKVTVQPAELVDGGIAVFSSDRAQSGTSEPPSAHNGWNVVVYKWDPRRTSEVTIIEAPGASNGWRQLVLKNGNHNVSVLVVDWQREGAQSPR